MENETTIGINSAEDKQNSAPDITVIVSVWNRVDIVGRCLDALEKQETSATTFEVVVVDDGLEDGTDRLLAEYVEKGSLDLKVIRHEKNKNLAAARNTGLKHARSPLVLFLDADIVAKPDVVETHADYHRRFPNHNVVILGNVKRPPEWLRTPYVDKADHTFLWHNLKPNSKLLWWDFCGGHISAKKSFLLSVGGFNMTFPRKQDTEMGWRLNRVGMKILYASEAVTFHYHQRTPNQAIRICRVEAQILAEMWKSGDSELRSYVSGYGWYTDKGLKASIKACVSALLSNRVVFPVTSRGIDLLMPRLPWFSTQLFRMLRYHVGRSTFKRELRDANC